jgi:hypothetical protein
MQNLSTAVPDDKYRFCFKCKWEGPSGDKFCPQCRKPLRTRAFIRITGGVMTAMGGFLVLIMGLISLWMMQAVANSNNPNAHVKFNGTKNDLFMIAGIFGTVLVFGFASLTAGLYQLIVGRRNMGLLYVMMILGTLLFVGGSVLRGYLGD